MFGPRTFIHPLVIPTYFNLPGYDFQYIHTHTHTHVSHTQALNMLILLVSSVYVLKKEDMHIKEKVISIYGAKFRTLLGQPSH